MLHPEIRRALADAYRNMHIPVPESLLPPVREGARDRQLPTQERETWIPKEKES